MHLERSQAQLRARKRIGPALKIAAVVLAVAVLTVAGLRLHSWRGRGQEARLMTLVNPWNSVESVEFTPRLTDFEGVQVDKSIVEPLRALLTAAESAGYAPQVYDGYLSPEEQQRRYEGLLETLRPYGYTEDEAQALARELIYPGYCEQELGLTVAITNRPGTDDGLAAWLAENSWQQGFILRYPEDGMEDTGMSPNNTLYRYVGEAVAGQIHSLGITLEEYQSLFYGETAAIVFE